MARRAALTDAELDQIADMTESGKSSGQIALKIGCSLGSVTWAQLRIGADPHPDRLLPPVPAERKTVYRDSGAVHCYTAADDELLLRLEAEGLRLTDIGRRLNPPRRFNSVKGRLMTLARRAAREEAANG